MCVPVPKQACWSIHILVMIITTTEDTSILLFVLSTLIYFPILFLKLFSFGQRHFDQIQKNLKLFSNLFLETIFSSSFPRSRCNSLPRKLPISPPTHTLLNLMMMMMMMMMMTMMMMVIMVAMMTMMTMMTIMTMITMMIYLPASFHPHIFHQVKTFPLIRLQVSLQLKFWNLNEFASKLYTHLTDLNDIFKRRGN